MKRGRPRKDERCVYVTTVMNSYRAGAAARGIIFDLMIREVEKLIFGNCHYCGSKPMMQLRRHKSKESFTFTHNGIDRKYSHLGYEPKNVVTCCTRCNFAKGTMRYDDWLMYLDEMVQFRTRLY